MEALVSIITPVYNAEKFLEETIQSVLNQRYQNWEQLFIDDCSQDNSIKIIESYEKQDKRIKILKLKKNSGAAVARNIGIKNAKGRYIAFLDSDDIWTKEKLMEQIKFMEDRDIDFSYTSYMKIDEEGNERGLVKAPAKVTYHQLLKSNVIGCLTAIYNAEKLGKVFMPDIRKRQDHGLWLKILKDHTDGYGLETCLAHYRVREGSISSNKFNAAIYQWRLYRNVEKLNLLKSIYYFINYTYYGLKKQKI